jgi:tRNA dimethylallyltransferase
MEELARCDPLSAGRIHLNDEYRILRALEVFRLSGRPLSSYKTLGAVPAGASSAEEGAREGRYRFLLVGLEREREDLYRRINERCAAMFRAGLPAEVRGLIGQGYGPGDPGLKAIGYREFFTEEPPGEYRLAIDFAGVETLVARNSRRYAKRQITFFAAIPRVNWIRLGEEDDGAERVLALTEEFLGGPRG